MPLYLIDCNEVAQQENGSCPYFPYGESAASSGRMSRANVRSVSTALCLSRESELVPIVRIGFSGALGWANRCPAVQSLTTIVISIDLPAVPSPPPKQGAEKVICTLYGCRGAPNLCQRSERALAL